MRPRHEASEIADYDRNNAALFEASMRPRHEASEIWTQKQRHTRDPCFNEAEARGLGNRGCGVDAAHPVGASMRPRHEASEIVMRSC